jgi:hypothetical protein
LLSTILSAAFQESLDEFFRCPVMWKSFKVGLVLPSLNVTSKCW